MKKFILILLSVTGGATLFAQLNTQVFPSVPSEQLKQKIRENTEYFVAADTLFFSHSAGAGSVYILPLDQLPCLRPDHRYTDNMPVHLMRERKPVRFTIDSSRGRLPFLTAIPFQKPFIPNAYRGKPLVWEAIPDSKKY